MLIAGLLGVLGLLATMAIGPLQGYSAGADHVQQLAAERNQLQDQVRVLEDRRELLLDPDHVELIARAELGLVKPGEIPYTVVSPDADDQQVRPAPQALPEPQGGPWYERFARSVSRLFDAEDL